ncbi:MAG: dihydropteroate synthase [Phycisphaerae bacterium]|nr:dihydropteroate synthase [Phycisphaerae bacterium]
MSISLVDILRSHHTRRPVVMGVLNVTPDSFSDGGAFFSPDDATRQARRMLADGADVIDIGAESTRPGSDRVSPDDQISRLAEILPAVCAAARQAGALVSIDTTRSAVARFALDAGAAILNDISAGRDDPEMFPLAAERKVPVILMHMLGQPATMQADPRYEDVVAEVKAFLTERIAVAVAAGLPREYCIVDPGIGFGKRLEHNLALLAGVRELTRLGVPVLLGPSRKRFLGELTGATDPADRLGGTIGACVTGYSAGASIFRVHDVAPVRQALTVAAAVNSV